MLSKKPRCAAGFVFRNLDFHACTLQQSNPARPISPVPSKPSVPGSGMTTFVSPLAMLLPPLKNPFPGVNRRLHCYLDRLQRRTHRSAEGAGEHVIVRSVRQSNHRPSHRSGECSSEQRSIGNAVLGRFR